MSDFYTVEASANVKEYVSVKKGMRMYERHCQMSEFQYFSSDPITVEADEDSGRVFQDFLYDRGVPLISDSFKECLDDLGVDYLLYKKVILTKPMLGQEEIYWLALPHRINCLNREESVIDEELNYADRIVINESKIGRFEVFKLAGVTNLDIIATKRIADVLRQKRFKGLHINKID